MVYKGIGVNYHEKDPLGFKPGDTIKVDTVSGKLVKINKDENGK